MLKSSGAEKLPQTHLAHDQLKNLLAAHLISTLGEKLLVLLC